MRQDMMKTLCSSNIRELVSQVNKLNIKKEDIVSLCKETEQYILIYYGK